MKNKEVIIIGYSNVTPEGVALHTNIPATLKEGGVKSRVTWVSWDKIGDLLFKNYTEEKTVEGLNELRSKSMKK